MPESSALPQACSQARALAGSGDPTAARALLESAVDADRARPADGGPERPAALRDLAALYRRSGDPAAARRVLEEAVTAGQRLAATDPLTVLVAFDLAVVAEELANRHVARLQFGRVAALGPAALGADHPAVARARAYLTGGPAAAPVPPFGAADAVAAPAGVATAAPPPPLPTGVRPRSRRAYVLAGLGGVVVLMVVAALVRPGADARTAAAGAPSPAVSPAPSGPAPAGSGPAGPAPVASAPATASAAGPAAVPPTAASRTVTASTGPARPRAGAPAPTRTTAAPAARTRIVAPGNGSRVRWPFDARFTVSAADVAATGTVVALSICVAGRCYLDGRLDIIGTGAAPYTVYLGSTRPEGVGAAWRLRLDRVWRDTYADLVAEREQETADGTWGDQGSSMSRLNRTPVSTLTVTKS